MSEMLSTGDYIMSALNYMRVHGWCKHALEDGAGRVCALGALTKVSDKTGQDYVEAFAALRDHIPEDAKKSGTGIAPYNNTRSSFSEIETWFEKAALDEGVCIE